MDFSGLGRALLLTSIVFGLILFGIGSLIGYFISRPSIKYKEAIYKEIVVSDTTHLDDGRTMILQHKEFKQIK